MVQMAPNKSIVSATVLASGHYADKSDFYLLEMEVLSLKKTEQLQMPGAEKGAKLKAIISKEIADELNLRKGVKVDCELKKVSVDLWRVGAITVKSSGTKAKK